MGEAGLTERQKKWFATVEANFEKQTGRPVAVWVDILKGCPETRPKAQAAWLKATHGIGANHAAHILSAARPADGMGWDDAEGLRAACGPSRGRWPSSRRWSGRPRKWRG
jgi:hypothetical protein